MKPICVPCQRFYRPKQNDYSFVEGMPTHGAKPGTEEPDKWRPYKLWLGDLWECKGCGSLEGLGLGSGSWQADKKRNVGGNWFR